MERSTITGAALLVVATRPSGQQLSGGALVSALRQGGYVLVMRHASSPQQPPDKQSANPENLSSPATPTGRSKPSNSRNFPIHGHKMNSVTPAKACELSLKR